MRDKRKLSNIVLCIEFANNELTFTLLCTIKCMVELVTSNLSTVKFII